LHFHNPIIEANQSDEGSIEVVVSEKNSSHGSESQDHSIEDEESISANSKSKTGLGGKYEDRKFRDEASELEELQFGHPNYEIDQEKFFDFSKEDICKFIEQDKQLIEVFQEREKQEDNFIFGKLVIASEEKDLITGKI